MLIPILIGLIPSVAALWWLWRAWVSFLQPSYADIGFTPGGELDKAALLNYCKQDRSRDYHVTIMYNQAPDERVFREAHSVYGVWRLADYEGPAIRVEPGKRELQDIDRLGWYNGFSSSNPASYNYGCIYEVPDEE